MNKLIDNSVQYLAALPGKLKKNEYNTVCEIKYHHLNPVFLIHDI